MAEDNVLKILFESGPVGGNMAAPTSPVNMEMASTQRRVLGFDPVGDERRKFERERSSDTFSQRIIERAGKGLAAAPGALGGSIASNALSLIMSSSPGALAAGALGSTVSRALSFTENTAAQAARFSGPVAQAQAQAQVVQTQRQIREAEQLGPALTRFIEQQSRASDELAKLLLPIKEVIVEIVAKSMKVVADILAEIRALLVEWGWLAEEEREPLRNLIDDLLALSPEGAPAPIEPGAAADAALAGAVAGLGL